ncbi:hypothetical protein [Nocardia nova]|uniref:hypothetical protein n=1 Tax=Nocardia nova TaxID=37330 RepID=UPI0033F28B95
MTSDSNDALRQSISRAWFYLSDIGLTDEQISLVESHAISYGLSLRQSDSGLALYERMQAISEMLEARPEGMSYYRVSATASAGYLTLAALEELVYLGYVRVTEKPKHYVSLVIYRAEFADTKATAKKATKGLLG